MAENKSTWPEETEDSDDSETIEDATEVTPEQVLDAMESMAEQF